MSLINQMLKDLDKRRRQGEPGANKGIPAGVQQLSQPAGATQQSGFFSLKWPSISRRLKWGVLLIAGIFLGVTGWHYWQTLQRTKMQTTQDLSVSSVNAEVRQLFDSMKQEIAAWLPQKDMQSNAEIKASLNRLDQDLDSLLQAVEHSEADSQQTIKTTDAIASTHLILDKIDTAEIKHINTGSKR